MIPLAHTEIEALHQAGHGGIEQLGRGRGDHGGPAADVDRGAAFAVVAVSQDVQVAFGSGHRSAEASASRTCAGGHLSYLAACRLPVSRTAVL
jgi:hypothetical protein